MAVTDCCESEAEGLWEDDACEGGHACCDWLPLEKAELLKMAGLGVNTDVF